MAFGKFDQFKEKIRNFGQKVKNGIQKVMPYIEKGVNLLKGKVPDVIEAVGGITGNEAITSLGGKIRKGAETINKGLEFAQNGWRGKPKDSFKEINYADNPPAPI